MNKASKIIVSILALAILAGVVFYFQNSANKAVSNSSKVEIPEGWKVYRNDKAGYSIAYPDYFDVAFFERRPTEPAAENLFGNKEIAHETFFNPAINNNGRAFPNETLSNTIITIIVYEDTENITTEQWAEKSGKNWYYLYPSEIKKRNIKINGLDAFIFEFAENSDVYISKNGKLFLLSENVISNNNDGDLKELKQIFKTMLGSLTID